MTGIHALFTAQTPNDLLATLVAFVFGLLPGLAMGVAAARRLRLGWAAALAGAFAISAALASAIMFAGGALHLTLTVGIALYAVGAVALTGGAWLLSRGTSRLSCDLPGLALGGVAVLAALVERPWFKVSADTFYHLAAARSLVIRNALVVTDPFHGTSIAVADPSSGVLHTMMAICARTTGLDMAMLFSGWTALGALVLALAFYALVKRLAPVQWAAAVGTAAYLVANQFLDFRAAGYPNRVSLALVFFGILALTEVFDRPSWLAAVLAVASGIAVSAMHVGNAELFFIVAGALVFWALVDAIVGRWRDRAWAFDGVLALGGTALATVVLGLPFILPKFGVVNASSMVDTVAAVSRSDLFQIGPFVIAKAGRFFDGGTVTFVLVTALALFIAGWSLVKRDRVALSAFAICSLPLMLLVDPPVTTLLVRYSFYNLARISGLLGFTLDIAIAWTFARPKKSGGRSQAVFLAVVALVAAVGISLPYLQTTWTDQVAAVRKGMNVSVWLSRASDVRNRWGYDTLDRIRGLFSDSVPMVAADPETGYYLAGLANVRLVAAPRSHSPLAIEEKSGPARRQAIAQLLYPTATVAQSRAILDRYGADYKLLWRSLQVDSFSEPSVLGQTSLFRPAISTRHLVLLRVLR